MSEKFCVAGCASAGAHRRGCTRPDCAGCLPNGAQVGFLCAACWSRLEQALAAWQTFSGAVIAFGRLVQPEPDGRKGRPDGFTTLTQTFLDVDEAESFLRTLPAAGGQARAWVARMEWAMDAVQFTRLAERAFRTHEVAQRDGKLRRWRCPTCHQTNPHELTLWLKQPKWLGDDRVIYCINDCGYVVSMDKASAIANAEQAEAVA